MQWNSHWGGYDKGHCPRSNLELVIRRKGQNKAVQRVQSSLSERELFRNIMQSPYQSPIGVLAGFITFVYLKYKQIKSIINNFSTLTKLCTLLRTGRTKTIPYPVTHPRLGNIREFPLPPFSEALSDQTTPLITTSPSQRPFLSLQNKITYSIEHSLWFA